MKLKQLIRRINFKAHFWLLRHDCKKVFRIKWIRPYTKEDFEIKKIWL